MAGPVSRRQLLIGGGLGASAVVAAAAGMSPIRFEAAAESQHVHDEKPRQWAMVIDLRKCDGCKKCTEACQTEHELPQSFEWIKVFQVQDKHGQLYNMPRPLPAT